MHGIWFYPSGQVCIPLIDIVTQTFLLDISAQLLEFSLFSPFFKRILSGHLSFLRYLSIVLNHNSHHFQVLIIITLVLGFFLQPETKGKALMDQMVEANYGRLENAIPKALIKSELIFRIGA